MDTTERTVRVGLFLLSGVVACAPGVSLERPYDEGASLLVHQPADDMPTQRGYAVASGDPLPSLFVRPGESVFLLRYEAPLGAIGLEPGPVNLVGPGDGRNLPPSQDIYRLQSEWTAWEAEDDFPRSLATVRLPRLEACDNPNACQRYVDGTLTCDLPCPAESPLATVEPVRAPLLELVNCPPGYSPSLDGPCEGPPPVRDCPEGAFAPVGQSTCEALLPCPSTGPFRILREAAVYVDAEAPPGGRGTLDAPVRTLAEALTNGSDPLFVALGAGTYERITVPPGRTVYIDGLCPEASEIDSIFVEGVLHLGGVSLIGQTVIPLNVEMLGSAHLEGVEVRGPVNVRGHLEARRMGLRSATDGIRVFAGARAAVEAASLAANRISVDARGAAALTRVVVFGANTAASIPAIRVISGGELNAIDSVMDHANRPLMFQMSGGVATATRTHLSGRLLLRATDDADFTGRDLSLRWTGQLAQLSDDARVAFERAHLRGDAIAPHVHLWDRARLNLLSTRAQFDGGDFVRAEDRAFISMEDVEILGRESRTQILNLTEKVRADLRRVRGQGTLALGRMDPSGRLYDHGYTGGPRSCAQANFPRDPNSVVLEAEDLDLFGAGAGVEACPGTKVNLVRLRARNESAGIVSACRQGCGINDFDSAEIAGTDIDLAEGRVGLLAKGGRVSLERVRLRNLRDFGLYAWGSELTARDVDADGVRTSTNLEDDPYCSENRGSYLRGPSSVVMAEGFADNERFLAGASVRLTRFRLAGGGCAGISLGVDGGLTLNSGIIVGNRRGLNYLRSSSPAIAEDVLFRANAFDLYGFAPDFE